MADSLQLNFLLEQLPDPAGRKAWLDFKLKSMWVDLSAADFTEQSLRDFDLSDANLTATIFFGADLAGADFADANLALCDLRRADLRNACMDRANLSGANLHEANLVDARLENARLTGCRLTGARLTGADLASADLENADLRGATLKYVRLTGARLDGANVAEADLTGALLDDDAPDRLLNFDQAIVDDRRYRQMRSRLRVSQQVVLGQDPAGGDSAVEQPAALPGRGVTGSRPAAERTRDLSDDSGAQFPERETEPDLETIEGCCAVLGVAPETPIDEIVKAFRKKAKIYHPDKVRHLSPRLQELAGLEFQRLHRAYERLTRHTTRPLKNIRWAEGVPRRMSPYEYTSEEYEKLAAANPGNADILYNLGWKYFEEGRHEEARRTFEKVLQLNPQDADAEYNLVIIRVYSEIQLPYFS